MCTKNILPTGRLETQEDDQVQCLAKIEVLQRKLAHVQGARLHLLGFPSPLDSIHVGVHLASDSIFPFFCTAGGCSRGSVQPPRCSKCAVHDICVMKCHEQFLINSTLLIQLIALDIFLEWLLRCLTRSSNSKRKQNMT